MKCLPSHLFFLSSALLCSLSSSALAEELSPYRAHDLDRPRPPVVTPAPLAAPVTPPSDAIVLFNGQDLENWEQADGSEMKWLVQDGALVPTPNCGYIRTKDGFGDVQLHVEWATPNPPHGVSQGRGNSGVYLMGMYEIQVLDSYQAETYADGQAAALYGQNPPLVNACLPPGQWQSYDIIFRRPHFAPDGKLLSPANVTVIHNGVLVQDHFELWGPTNWLKYDPYTAHPDKLPLAFQDHGNPVRFRNIWLRELPPLPTYQGLAEAQPKIALTATQRERLVGDYLIDGQAAYQIRVENQQLVLRFWGRDFDLVPQSATCFLLKRTNGSVDFQINPDGTIQSVTVDLMGDTTNATRGSSS